MTPATTPDSRPRPPEPRLSFWHSIRIGYSASITSAASPTNEGGAAPRVLSEVRRVLAPGAPIYITEVMNSSFLLHPYSPNTWRYWMAFNDFQYDSGGDPFIGAKLGNLLLAGGFRDVVTEIKTVHFDNREPARRKDMIAFWEELLLSAADSLVYAERVTQAVVDGMRQDMHDVQNDPDAVFFYAFVQARATVY